MNLTGARRASGVSVLLLAVVGVSPARAQTCSPGAQTCAAGHEILLHCNASPNPQDVPVPASCAHMKVKVWGGGGSAGCAGTCPYNFVYQLPWAAGDGGGGAAIIANIDVSTTPTVRLVIPSPLSGSARGGNKVDVLRAVGASWVPLLIAGGGGGGGINLVPASQGGDPCFPAGGEIGHGAAGGGISGQDAAMATYRELRPEPCVPNGSGGNWRFLGGGRGGTQASGGVGGTAGPAGIDALHYDGQNGSLGVGGPPGQPSGTQLTNPLNGAGGDGFYGGGAGAASVLRFVGIWDTTIPHTTAGGGGGSSFIASTGPAIQGVMYPGSGRLPGNFADVERGTAGDGGKFIFTTPPGTGTGGHGGAGRVVIRMSASPYAPPPPPPPPPPAPPLMVELTHGYRSTETFAVGLLPENLHRIHQEPYSSYEVVVDATSGDIGNPPTTPVKLDRTDAVGTVLGTAVGAGPTQSLRWTNASSTANSGDLVRVASTTCTTNCGPDDQYRIRAYDTTYAIARFNNSATQATSLVLENTTAASVDATVYFWSGAGVLLYTHAVPTMAPKAVHVFATPSVTALQNQSGAITVTSTAPYARLSGKAVAIDMGTASSFDTPMVPRRR